MATKSEGIRVHIYDQAYTLRSESDEQYTRELAQAVDETMRSISEKTHTYDSLRLAVLAALHFADECERLQQQQQALRQAVTEKASRCSEALDGVLSETG